MSLASARPQCLAFFGTTLMIEPSPDQLSGDAGLLPIRQFDQCIGLTQAFAEALDDPRDPALTEHKQLGSDRFAEREAASKALDAIGEPALVHVSAFCSPPPP